MQSWHIPAFIPAIKNVEGVVSEVIVGIKKTLLL